MNLRADRRVMTVAGAAVLLIFCLVIFNYSLSLKKENEKLKAGQKEFRALAESYVALKRAVDSAEGKKSLSSVEGVVQAVDEIFRSLGLNQKVKSVKSIGTSAKKYGLEEEAEVQVEKVTMNEMMNILYRLENAPMVLSVKRTTIKPSFDSPSLMNMTIAVGLVTPK